uniref:Uncharacterized protein n=1 Tax=Caenorhabditis japonica TaxID=281687 RepID=A0A8R1IKQ7_CAEJA
MSMKYILIVELTSPATTLVPDLTILYTAQDRWRQPPYTFLINSAHHVTFLSSVLRTSLLIRLDSHSNLTNNLSGTQNNFPHDARHRKNCIRPRTVGGTLHILSLSTQHTTWPFFPQSYGLLW